jgi:hypothetical protein
VALRSVQGGPCVAEITSHLPEQRRGMKGARAGQDGPAIPLEGALHLTIGPDARETCRIEIDSSHMENPSGLGRESARRHSSYD